MSKIALSPNASGTALFTIASPATNTDRTLTLPDEGGTLMSTAASITHSQLPSGSVLQAVNTTYATLTAGQTISSGTTYTEVTGLQTSITKVATSSKIMCISSVMVGHSSGAWWYAKVLRDATTQVYETMRYDHTSYGGGIENVALYNFYDDTSSISAGTSITYNFYAAPGSNNIIFNWNGNSSNYSTSTIFLLEIAA